MATINKFFARKDGDGHGGIVAALSESCGGDDNGFYALGLRKGGMADGNGRNTGHENGTTHNKLQNGIRTRYGVLGRSDDRTRFKGAC